MKGTCHCGAVSVTTEGRPDYINLCDCSLCLKAGGAWGYFTSAQVEIDGRTSCYRRKDFDEPAVEMHFCENCGASTHWLLTEHFEGDQVGVNMRIFEPADLAGIEARILDGRNWTGDEAPKHRRAPGHLGKDVFI